MMGTLLSREVGSKSMLNTLASLDNLDVSLKFDET